MSSRCRSDWRLRGCAAAAGLLLVLTSTGCEREQRHLRPAPGGTVLFRNAARESDLQPGGSQPTASIANPSHGNALDLSEGQRLFDWYNCSGCHAHGGGGIGPPLIKKTWIYGGEPANLFDTIVKGRPNGMPAWGSRIPEYQIWQLVTYVRSMNHLEPQAATPARADGMEQDPHTVSRPVTGETR